MAINKQIVNWGRTLQENMAQDASKMFQDGRESLWDAPKTLLSPSQDIPRRVQGDPGGRFARV